MAEKNKGGRPRGSCKYTYDELEEIIGNYFGDDRHKPYSVLELCSELGVTYETLCEWEHNEEKGFSELIKKAKHKIAAGWEKGELNPALSIFLLKNHMKYTDKQEHEVTGANGGPLEFKWKDE